MMKQDWQKPVLEVLDVSKTMASTEQGDYIDASFPENTRWKDMTWGFDS